MKTRAVYSFYKWLGFIIAAIVAGVSAILGGLEDVPMQHIVFYTVAIFALILWGWHHCSVRWIYRSDGIALSNTGDHGRMASSLEQQEEYEASYIRILVTNNKGGFIGLLIMIVAFIITAVSIDDFFQWRNVLAVVVLAAFIILTFILNRLIKTNKSAFIGIAVLVGLFIIGSLQVEGFLSALNIKSMLLFASFLGLACIGQTLVALLGGLDLSIPFVIGS